MCVTNYIRYILKCKREKINIYNMGCNQSTPPTRPTSVPAFEETRYQITFLLEHEII